MSLRPLALLAMTMLVACTIETDPNKKKDAGKSEPEPVDPNEPVSYSECKKLCAARLTDDVCGETQADANKNCNALCLGTHTGHQMACVVALPCDDLTHEDTVADLCPEATK